MSKLTAVILSLAVVLAFATTASWAQQDKAADANQKATDASPDRAASPVGEQKMLSVVGTVNLKTEKVNEQEMKVPYIKVKEAKSQEGQNQLAVIGKNLKIEGTAAPGAAQMEGKEVSAQGTVKDDTIMATALTLMDTEKNKEKEKEKQESKDGHNGGMTKPDADTGHKGMDSHK